MPRRSSASLGFPAFTRMERLIPPPELSQDERQIFVDIISTNQADHFRAADSPLLVAYCRAILIDREAKVQGYSTIA